jgi:hypothetical protein
MPSVDDLHLSVGNALECWSQEISVLLWFVTPERSTLVENMVVLHPGRLEGWGKISMKLHRSGELTGH